MVKNIRLIVTITVILLFLMLAFTAIIIKNSPYYTGFEYRLDYLSPDLSENRSIIRDRVAINRNSSIKLVFEKKDDYIAYDEDQFQLFLKDLEIRIWNNNEFYEYKYSYTSWPGSFMQHIILEVGSIEGTGDYTVYIKSDLGRNAAYHIGIGIGRGSGKRPISTNRRSFY